MRWFSCSEALGELYYSENEDESGDAGASLSPSDEVLRSWGMQLGADTIPVLMLPYPVAVLVCNGEWRDLLILARWHFDLNFEKDKRRINLKNKLRDLPCLLPGWPPRDAKVWNCIGRHREVQVDLHDPGWSMSPERLEEMLAQLRQWAPAIVALDSNGAGRGGQSALLQGFVTHLQVWVDGMRDASGHGVPEQGEIMKLRYSSERLFEFIRFSQQLCGGPGQLVECLQSALQLSLPPMLRGMYTGPNNKFKSTVPSATLLRHYEFSVDVAMILLDRERALYI